MFLTQYDEKKTLEMEREEGREEGRAEGLAEGEAKGRKEGVDAFAAAVQEKYNISKDELDALKAELGNSKDAVKA